VVRIDALRPQPGPALASGLILNFSLVFGLWLLIHIIVIAEARLDQALLDHLIEQGRIIIAGPGPVGPPRYWPHAKAIFHPLDTVPGVVLELRSC